MTQPGAVSAEQQWSDYLTKLAASFKFFLAEVFRLKWGFTLHWIQEDIADFMQYGPKRRVVIGLRGLSKTDCATVYADWRHFTEVVRLGISNEHVLIGSKSEKHAKSALFQCRGFINSIPFLNMLHPRDRAAEKGGRDNKLEFDIGPTDLSKTPSMRAQGVEGQLEGGRGSLVIFDDVETTQNTVTRDSRLTLAKRVEEAEYIAADVGDVLALGTVKHAESVYKVMADRGYTVRNYTLRAPFEHENTDWLAPCIRDRMAKGILKPGQPTWPERWDAAAVQEVERRTPMTFAMEMMGRLDLSNAERHPLKLRDLIVHPCTQPRDKAPTEIAWGHQDSRGSTRIDDIQSVGFGTDGFYRPVYVGDTWLPYSGCKAFVDPAGSGADSFTWAIVAHLYGNLFLKHVGAFKEAASHERLTRIVLSLREHNVRDVRVETNYGGNSYMLLLEPIIRKLSLKPGSEEAVAMGYPAGWSCSIDGEYRSRRTGFKEMFICDTLEPVFASHRLIVDPSVARNSELSSQMVNIMRERRCLDHEDELDAVAGAVDMWKDVLDLDSETMNVRREADARDEAVRAFLADLHGHAPVAGHVWGRPARPWAN